MSRVCCAGLPTMRKEVRYRQVSLNDPQLADFFAYATGTN